MYRVQFMLGEKQGEFSFYEGDDDLLDIVITGLDTKGIDFRVMKDVQVDATWQFKPSVLPKKFLDRFRRVEQKPEVSKVLTTEQYDCCGGACALPEIEG
jgi:hypothetical protein